MTPERAIAGVIPERGRSEGGPAPTGPPPKAPAGGPQGGRVDAAVTVRNPADPADPGGTPPGPGVPGRPYTRAVGFRASIRVRAEWATNGPSVRIRASN